MSNKRALETQQQEYLTLRISKVGRSCMMLLATILSFAAIGLVGADLLYRSKAFEIDQLKIKGQFVNLAPQDIEIVVREKLSGNFFSIELDEIKAEVAKVKWVQQVDVRREWPNTLLVHVTEHTPVMAWNKDKWLNTKGEIIDLPNVVLDKPIKLKGNAKESKKMLEKAYSWQQELNEYGLTLDTLVLSDSYAWKLGLHDEQDNKFNLVLGSENIAERFERFENVYKNQIKNSNLQLQRIDARYPDGLAIKAIERPQAELALVNETQPESIYQ